MITAMTIIAPIGRMTKSQLKEDFLASSALMASVSSGRSSFSSRASVVTGVSTVVSGGATASTTAISTLNWFSSRKYWSLTVDMYSTSTWLPFSEN